MIWPQIAQKEREHNILSVPSVFIDVAHGGPQMQSGKYVRTEAMRQRRSEAMTGHKRAHREVGK